MNIIGVQLTLVFFALFMVYVLFVHWKKGEISNLLFYLWLLTWSVFIFFSLFPKVLEPLIKELFIIRVMDLGMIVSFMVLTYILIETNIRARNLEKKIEKLIRKMALKDAKKI
jgi:hypothetical protein